MLSLRYAESSDIAFIAETQRHPEIREFVLAASDQDITASLNNPDEAFLIALRDDAVPVGFAYLRQISRPERSIELFRLAVSERNKGHGSVFIKLIIAEAFGPMNANRFWLDVFPQNTRARQVYKNCGFVEEGLLHEVYFRDGAFQSTIVMSILTSEYETR